ncbi:MAG: TfoX/Sxy family protein [Alphaproteobacteria bacterium]|nr:TfoX/Sxy family protein [Alphaproteobacteria bacterium]MDE2041908.1 TfoX/Sxy family protein [Alphaproteobacteria bacterium]MDE2341345.1 TfoX/Sxy family protein [Alphaproteobacteria bacterium]
MSMDGLVEWVAEALEDAAGTISARKMFGGLALYSQGRIFAMIADDMLWFKADAESDADWDAAGCPHFTYDFGDGKMAGSMNYRRAPDDVYDDAEAMRHWAGVALAAAARAPAKKPKARKKPA